MIKIAALNDSSLESCNGEEVGPSLEALEAAATRTYRDAIVHLAKKDFIAAKDCFLEALDNPFIEKANWKGGQDRPKTLPQDIALKYSCYKNLGNIHMSEKQYEEACNFFIKAVHLDESEVSLWQKLGSAAIKIKNFQLAMEAFQEGLLLNPLHWPCADQLLSVLFLLGFYEDCLGLIIQTLNRDPGYVKALAFRDKIFEFQPSLRSFAKEFFCKSDVLYKVVDYDKKKGETFVTTCLELRPPIKESKPAPVPSSRKLSKALSRLAWEDLTSSLAMTYDDALITDDIKVITEEILLGDILNEFINSKQAPGESRAEQFLCTLKPGRRISRSLSQDNELEGEGQVSRVSTRRQTIELGEYQNLFKVGTRKSPEQESEAKVPVTIAEEPQENVEALDSSTKQTELKNENYEVKDEPKMNNLNELNKGSKEKEPSKSLAIPEACTNDPKMEESSEPTAVSMEKEISSSMDVEMKPQQTDDITEEASKDPLDSLEKTEPDHQPNVDLTKEGIFAKSEEVIQIHKPDDVAPTASEGEPLDNLNTEQNPGIVSDDNKLPFMEGIIPFPHEELDIFVSPPSLDLLPQHFLLSSNPKPIKSQKTKSLKSKSLTHFNKKQSEVDTEKDSSQEKDHPELASCSKNPNKSSNESAPVPKKSKRPKRGLERELEQLDYWGRRKAREEKRRRRTLTSKLVGAFEESEYLTWAQVLRSFLPAGLLTDGDADTNPRDKRTSIDSISSTEGNADRSKEMEPAEKCENSALPTDTPENKKNAKLSLGSLEAPCPHLYNYLKKVKPNWTSDQWSMEELQVANFMCQFRSNGGVFHVLQQLQMHLIYLHGKNWSLTAANDFIDIYRRVRSMINFGSTVSSLQDTQKIFKLANASLTFIELNISIWMAQNSPEREEESLIDQKDMDQIEEDLFELNLLLERPDVWKEEYLQTYLRICWIHAQLKIIQGSPYEAVAQLQVLLEEMKLSLKDEQETIAVERCKIHPDKSQISIEEVTKQLNFFQRSQMLEQVEPKYNAQLYSEAIEILICMFHKGPQGSCDAASTPRHLQFFILLDSLFIMRDYKGVVEWGSRCMSEATKTYQNLTAENQIEKDQWEDSIRKMIILIHDAYLSEESMINKVGTGPTLPKLLQSLMSVLVLQLESNSEGSFPCFRTITSWLLFYHILSQYEHLQQDKKSPTEKASPPESQDGDSGDGKLQTATLFPSTLFLITAHEELGKNGWCALEGGRMLLLAMDVLIQEHSRLISDDQKVMLTEALEQVAFCLYTHPSRKNKCKHLKDHGVHQIALTWKRGLQLYNYYLPSQLPDFQSSQMPSISEDVSLLFKRILTLTPEEYDRETDLLKHIEDFLENDVAYETLKFPQELSDCHYLLADFYFKNKNWDLAIYHYKLDVSLNPKRLNSWAPMGLAIKAKLETLLNSCDVIDNLEVFFREAHISRKCLEKALLIDQYYCNLWVEKGGLVYMIHSHASRLLKQDLDPDMSIERFETLEKIKKDFLNEAERCFYQAYLIVEEGWDDESLPDERWLYQYMLGKVAEKKGKPTKEIINYYLKASELLHEIGAKYPLKVSYSNPQENAIGAMEMFFRIICLILKNLKTKEEKGVSVILSDYFKNILSTLFEGPFVKCQERKGLSRSAMLVKSNETTAERKNMELKDFCYDLSEKILKESLLRSLQTIEEREKTSPKNSKENTTDPNEGEESAPKGDVQYLIHKCLEGLKICVSRFPHHYKSLYRLSYHYHHSKDDLKDNHKARNFIFGCEFWQKLDYMPVNGLFHDRKIWSQNLRICNLFHGIWRIPHDEIDRPGSFAAHMYKCVCLSLDILQEMRDFYSVLEIALSLKNSPDKDRKYLRDNERELLSEHAAHVGLQTMKDKYRLLSKPTTVTSTSMHCFITDVYKAYKYISRNLPSLESPLAKMLVEAYTSFKNIKVEVGLNILKEAELFCMKSPMAQRSGLQTPIRGPPPSSPPVGNSPSISYPANRRGRPPGPSKIRATAPPKDTSDYLAADSIAIQQAYKVYENLIQAQTMINNKNIDAKSYLHFQKKHDQYKQQMLNYLQIPSVAQYFHSSLQSLGTSAAKLPPPPADLIDPISSQGLTPDKPSIDTLAAKSQMHGISISPVSKRATPLPAKVTQPAMSITVSQISKSFCNSASLPFKKGDQQPVVSKYGEVSTSSKPLPKLPEGTTLSVQSNTTETKQQSVPKTDSRAVQITKIPHTSETDEQRRVSHQPKNGEASISSKQTESLAKKLQTDLSSKRSVDPDTAKENSSNVEFMLSPSSSCGSSENKNKSKSRSSFQAAFQAAISSSDAELPTAKRKNMEGEDQEPKKSCVSSESHSSLKDSAKSTSSTRYIPKDPLDPNTIDDDEDDIIVLD